MRHGINPRERLVIVANHCTNYMTNVHLKVVLTFTILLWKLFVHERLRTLRCCSTALNQWRVVIVANSLNDIDWAYKVIVCMSLSLCCVIKKNACAKVRGPSLLHD